jgi:hypothetical protein
MRIDIMMLGIIILIAAMAYGSLSLFLPERLRNRTICGREPLGFDDIYQRYFSASPFSKALLADIWRETSNDLKLDAEKLRPTDRFNVELGAFGFPLVDLNEALAVRLKEQMRLKNWRGRFPRMNTLAEYIEFYAQLQGEDGGIEKGAENR